MGGVKETLSRRKLYERFNVAHLNQDIEPPEDGEHIWSWFWELSNKRHQGMNGPQPLTYPDINMWSRMTGTILLREEIAILMQMDDAYIAAVADEHKAQRDYGENKGDNPNKKKG